MGKESQDADNKDVEKRYTREIVFIVLGLVFNFIGWCLNFDQDPIKIIFVLISINVILFIIYAGTGKSSKS